MKACIHSSIESFAKDLRLLAADGAFIPVPTCAEVLLFSPHDLLQSAHIGSVRARRRGERVQVVGDE